MWWEGTSVGGAGTSACGGRGHQWEGLELVHVVGGDISGRGWN